MIQFTKAFKAGDGTMFNDLAECKKHEIGAIIADAITAKGDVAQVILDKADVIVDILTTKASSKPKARAVNGGTKKRAPKAAPAAAENTATP